MALSIQLVLISSRITSLSAGFQVNHPFFTLGNWKFDHLVQYYNITIDLLASTQLSLIHLLVSYPSLLVITYVLFFSLLDWTPEWMVTFPDGRYNLAQPSTTFLILLTQMEVLRQHFENTRELQSSSADNCIPFWSLLGMETRDARWTWVGKT